MSNRDAIEQLVRRLLVERLSAVAPAANGTPSPGLTITPPVRPTPAGSEPRAAPQPASEAGDLLDLINVAMVEAAAREGRPLRMRAGAIVTPLAREEAEKRGVTLTEVAPPTKAASTAPAGSAPVRGPANPKQIALGSDHGGFALKRELAEHLRGLGYAVHDVGTHGEEPVDYPDIAHQVAQAIVGGEARAGIVIDGAGIGSAIAANKVPGIRCAQARDLFEIRNSREHNDTNMLSLGGRILGVDLAKAMVTLWLETPFAGGRHARRVAKIAELDGTYRR